MLQRLTRLLSQIEQVLSQSSFTIWLCQIKLFGPKLEITPLTDDQLWVSNCVLFIITSYIPLLRFSIDNFLLLGNFLSKAVFITISSIGTFTEGFSRLLRTVMIFLGVQTKTFPKLSPTFLLSRSQSTFFYLFETIWLSNYVCGSPKWKPATPKLSKVA